MLGFLDVREWNTYMSPFAKATLISDRYDIFGEPVIKAIIDFKWRKFARTRFIIFISVYLVYLSLFMVAVTLDSDRVVLVDGVKENVINACLGIVFFLGSIFLCLEIMQMIGYRLSHYFKYVYNWIDLASIILPMGYVLRVFTGKHDYRLEYVGTSMFFVYINV